VVGSGGTGPAAEPEAKIGSEAGSEAKAEAGSEATTGHVDRRGRRLGIMGGTFDPIHNGHLVAASEVAHLFRLDEVVFVPTGQPSQKDTSTVSAAEDRYLMTVIATASNPRFSVSRVDVERPGKTYTIDTLREMREIYGPSVEFFFITGSDALAQMLSWRDTDELFTLAHFIGCTRPGHALSDPGLPQGKVSLVEVPALSISSTECRARVRAGEPIWYLVPDGIVQYIGKRGLYRDPQ
jgi:nicotinate-nucleotide adenylyltransferase